MKVVFCDFDGVLNSTQFLNHSMVPRPRTFEEKRFMQEWPDAFWSSANEKWDPAQILQAMRSLDPVAIYRLDQILEGAQAELVVSSFWRYLFSPYGLLALLENAGLKHPRLLGITPFLVNGKRDTRSPRGLFIEAFLRQYPSVSDFVILDDRGDMTAVQWHLVQTTEMRGLEPKHVDLALEKFSYQSEVDASSPPSRQKNPLSPQERHRMFQSNPLGVSPEDKVHFEAIGEYGDPKKIQSFGIDPDEIDGIAEDLFRDIGIRFSSVEEMAFAAIVGDQVVGAATLGRNREEEGWVFTFSVVVDEDWRRRGIAKKLVEAVMTKAAEDAEALEEGAEYRVWVVNEHMAHLLSNLGFDEAHGGWRPEDPHMTRHI